MNVVLIGISNYDFKNGEGERVKGKKFFCTYADDRVEGEGCLSFSLSSNNDFYKADVSVGDSLRLFYNRYGKVNSFEISA